MNIVSIAIQLFVLLFAITVHEASHGWAANRMGDPTAFNLGRVTLNPIAHIDPLGTILLPILISLVGLPAFGWAKPVPVNPYNLRNPRRDNVWISFAGPAANGLVALACFIILLILKFVSPAVDQFLKVVVHTLYKNPEILRSALPGGFFILQGLALLLYFAVLINIYLAVFNLIPIPPLDGSGVLMGLLSEEAAIKYDRIRPYGFLLVIGIIYMGVLNFIIVPIQLFIDLLLG
jgi:Zn-dependent protease